MDGIPSASFPAPMPPPPGAPAPPGQAPQAPTKPVGRPSADPEQQVVREERSVMKRRMAAALPKEMLEPRIAIYRLHGRKGTSKTTSKPLITVLLSELEEAQNDGAVASEFIRDKITEKFPDTNTRYLWEAQDHKGTAIAEYGKHEIDMNDGDEEYEDDENEETRYEDAKRGQPYPPRPPLEGSPLPPANFVKEIRSSLSDQYKRDENSSTMILQLMMQQQEQRRQEEAARMEREERRRDDQRREDMARAEREEQRRKDEQKERERELERKETREREDRRLEQERQMQFMKMIMDTSNKPDVALPMLMKMLDSKSDRDGTKELFGMFNETSKQSMLMQGEAAKHMMGAQAEASKLLISNILGISQQMVEAQLAASAPGEEGDDPMDKVGRIFKMLTPAISALSNGANTQQQLLQTQQNINNAQQAQQAPQQVRQQAPQQQQKPVTRKNNPEIPEAQWIKGGLDTIMNLEIGKIPPDQRFHALKWCADNLPDRMLTAIRSGDENNVFAIGQEGASPEFTAWLFEHDLNADFLRACVTDIRHILLNTITQEIANASLQAHMAHQQQKHGQPFPQSQQTHDTTAEVVQEKPKPTGKRSAPPPKDVPVAVDQPAEEKPAAEKPAAEKTVAEKTAVEQPKEPTVPGNI